MPSLSERGRVHRWLLRIGALCGTAAVLGTGVAIALMIAGGRAGEDVAEATAVATEPTPAPTAAPRKAAGKRGLSPRAKAARKAAVADVNAEGYSPVMLSAYRPDRHLRVLVAAPTGDSDAGRRAFFFAGRTPLGTDTFDNSARIRVLEAGGRRTVTLGYRLYAPGDKACCPSGSLTKVRFTWDATLGLQRLDPLPDPYLRVKRR